MLGYMEGKLGLPAEPPRTAARLQPGEEWSQDPPSSFWGAAVPRVPAKDPAAGSGVRGGDSPAPGQHKGSPPKRQHCLGYPKALLGTPHTALSAPGREPQSHPRGHPQIRGDSKALLRSPKALLGALKAILGGAHSAMQPQGHPEENPRCCANTLKPS